MLKPAEHLALADHTRVTPTCLFDKSFVLRSRFSLSFWDSMLLAARKDAGVDTLYSEKMDPR